LGIVLFIYILSRIDISELIVAFKEINLIYYLIGILFLISGFLIRVSRWKMLVSSTGAEISFKDLAKILMKGIFLGLITPGKVGEFWQAKYLASDTGISGGKAFYTTFMDRAVDILVMGIVAISGIMIIYSKFGGSQTWQLFVLIFILLLISAYFFIRRVGIQRVFKNLIKFLTPLSFKKRADSFLSEFYQGFKS